jgi:hypothetical protein
VSERTVIEGCSIATMNAAGDEHAGIADPVAGFVPGAPRPVDALLVGGRPVVDGGELRTADEREVSREVASASRRLVESVRGMA